MKVALIGYGKMGKAVEKAIDEYNATHTDDKTEIVLKINSQNLHQLNAADLKKADIAIEFTSPHHAVNNILACFDANIPVVTGTTGWYNKLNEVNALCIQKNGNLLYAPNFSIGMNIFFELNRKLAALMKNQQAYSITIRETHHAEKKDSPSGTAIKLAEQIIQNNSAKNKWVNAYTQNENELEIISSRTQNAAGIHEVVYSSQADTIELKHSAHSRKGFAEGALQAAFWLYKRKTGKNSPNGIFTMKDVLNL